MKKIIEFISRWGFTVIVSAAILYLTLVPKPLPAEHLRLFPHADKVVHALMFGGLMFAVTFDWARKYGLSTWTPAKIAVAFIAVTLSGGLIEVLQAWMDMGRGGDWFDFMADAVGAFLSAMISPYVVARMMKDRLR